MKKHQAVKGTQETVAPNDICLAYDNFLILYLPQIDELEARVEACKLEAQRINAQRIARIYAELQAGKDDFESDRHDLAEMERLNHCAAAITLVLPELRKQAQNISSRTRDIVSREEDAENRLQVVLNDRRLAEARRLANR